MTVTARFEINYHQILDEQSQLVDALPSFASDVDKLLQLYSAMVLTRTFDQKAVALQRTGQLGTYPSALGQEAIAVAVGDAMRPEDVLIPYYREYGAHFLRGVTMTEMLLYWGGDERGMNFAVPRKDFPVCIPIASQGPHAIGVAFAMKLRKEARVAVVFFGDGSTSKGDFYESLNAAAAWDLPVVFIVNNNQWAISVPLALQTRSQTLAQKAIAAGFVGEQVDGNDILAMRERVGLAIEKARAGQGPSLVEAISYRLSDHTTADDANRYRSAEEVAQHWKQEPIGRFQQFLLAQGFWDAAKQQKLMKETSQAVELAVQAYLDTPPQHPASMFEYLYEKLPSAYKPQRKELKGRHKHEPL